MHTPVLIKEVIEYLSPKPGRNFIDATTDGGGHALAIIEKIVPNGKLLGIEWDGRLLEQLGAKISESEFRENVILINDSYANLKNIIRENNFTDVDGIIFDLGMSSWHIDEAGRGFTFQRDEILDMRFAAQPSGSDSRTQDLTAQEIVNEFSYDELSEILKKYGEERFAGSIAKNIITTRKEKPIRMTFELVEIIKRSVPFWYRRRRIHFATRTFQALRLAVNHELENLEAGIEQAAEILRPGGRVAVISFHSLEDRIVKNLFRSKAKTGELEIITKKPVVASLAEVTENPRARSAKLRVAAKLSK